MIEIRLDAVADAIIVVGRDEARKLKHNCLYSIQWFANYLITAIERESRLIMSRHYYYYYSSWLYEEDELFHYLF